MLNGFSRDPEPDLELNEALRAAAGGEAQEPDWAALHRSIRERAELPLARQRRQHTRTRTVRWLRPLVPAAAAAGLALALFLPSGQPGDTPELASAGSEGHLRPVVEEVLGTNISDLEFDLLFGSAGTDALLLAAVEQR